MRLKIVFLVFFLFVFNIYANSNNNFDDNNNTISEIKLYKGWNLVSMQENDFTKYDNLIKLIWGYKNNKWYAYSSNDNIYSKIYNLGIPQLKGTNSNDGIWILSQKDANITVKNQFVKNYNIKKGWNLLETDKNIETSIFDNSCILYLWKYDNMNKKWQLYRSDGIDKYFGYDKFTKLEANSGFWAYANNSCKINIGDSINTSSNGLNDQNSTNPLSVSKSIVNLNESVVFNYNYNGENCSIDFGDGTTQELDSCSGSYTHTYDRAYVYKPKLISNGNEIAQTTVTVQNPSNEWLGMVTSLDNYKEPYENPADFIKDGRMYIAPSLSDRGYYWTNYDLIKPEIFQNIDGDNFSIEARVKDPESEGGISAYDTTIEALGTDSNVYAIMMGESWGQSWISIGAGTSNNHEVPELVQDFSDWKVVKLEVKDHNLTVYYEGNKIYTMPYEGSAGLLLGLHFCFKGSGSVDWVKVYDGNGNLVYFDNFNK